jgi:acetate kinase
MKTSILILNSGSSSIKYNLYQQENCQLILHGQISKIGEHDNDGVHSHRDALAKILELIQNQSHHDALLFVGHRVVHGGTIFSRDVAYLVDESLLQQIDQLSELAPLHNPVNLLGIKESIKLFKNVPQIVVFDSSFHHTIPHVAQQYAIPKMYSNKNIRKFGFHGISYKYVSQKVLKYLPEKEESKLIVLHLGNGCSACAIKNGSSIETSMGLTPLQGLIMGTRSGDVDPEVVIRMAREDDNNTIDKVEHILNYESGLKGICEENDMRTVVKMMKDGNADAKLAFDMFCYRIRQYIGSYFVTLGGCDAIVFTAGIGENSIDVRQKVCEGLECIGVHIDSDLNKKQSTQILDISTENSPVKILVVPTDEDKQIALMGIELLNNSN